MIPEKKLQSTLLAAASVAALVGTRVRMDLAEESDATPYLVVMRDETGQMHTLSEVIDNPDVVFELHCWADTRLAAETLTGAVMDAVRAAGWSITEYQGAFSREVGAHATILKVILD